MRGLFFMFLVACIGCTSEIIYVTQVNPDASDDRNAWEPRDPLTFAIVLPSDGGHPDSNSPTDAMPDAQKDTSVDSPADVAADVQSDSGIGGDTCPILTYNMFPTQCGNGFGFRTHSPDGGPDYPCGQIVPHCPKGWVCWQIDQNNKMQSSFCP